MGYRNSNLSIDSIPKNLASRLKETPETVLRDKEPVKSVENVKIFVGGIPGHLKNEDVSDYFGRFGEVQDCSIVYDQRDKEKPCGFAFMSVGNYLVAEKILGQSHYLHNTLVECKLALGKGEIKEKQELEMGRKIYVGGLPKNLPDKQ